MTNKLYYCKVSTLSEDGFTLDISSCVIELRQHWDNVGIEKLNTEEDWVEFVCWNSN